MYYNFCTKLQLYQVLLEIRGNHLNKSLPLCQNTFNKHHVKSEDMSLFQY